jgi:hypothetical protein
MAKPESDLAGEVVIPAEDVSLMVRKATQLPSTYFVTVGKAKVENDGSMKCKYTASTMGAPPPPSVDP